MDLSNIQGRYPVQPLNRKLLSVLVFFLMYLFSGLFGLASIALILGCIVTAVIFFITKDEKAESESSEIIKEIDGTTVLLLYILSFFIPLAGFIVGAIYASKDEEHYKHVGKNCLICSALNLGLVFIISFLLLVILF